MTEDQWIEYLKRSRTWCIRMDFELLHSKAYCDLKYGPAIKVLNWFHEKIRVKVNKKERGAKRYQVVNNGDIDFTYREAAFRGLTSHQFRNSLKELHRTGFIDIRRPGSALRGDYTIFSLSDRWKMYGTDDFVCPEFPKSVHWRNFGFQPKGKKRKS